MRNATEMERCFILFSGSTRLPETERLFASQVLHRQVSQGV